MAERDLLQNAYMAMQPIPEMKERFLEEIEKLVSMGRITRDEALAIRADQVLERELNEKMGFDPANVNEQSTYKVVKEAGERVTAEAVAKEKAEAARKLAQRRNELQQGTYKQAQKAGQEAKQKFIKWYTLGAKILAGGLLCIGIGGCVVSSFSGSIGIAPLIMTIFSALGVWDSIISRKSWIQGKIEKAGNKKEKETFNLEYKKMMEVVGTQQKQE